jgi:hypothetical protein
MKSEELRNSLEQIKDLWRTSARGLEKIRNMLKIMSKNKVIGCKSVIKQITVHQCGIADALLKFNIDNNKEI